MLRTPIISIGLIAAMLTGAACSSADFPGTGTERAQAPDPVPTYTPQATYTPLPTYTPWPTYTPPSTYTPAPAQANTGGEGICNRTPAVQTALIKNLNIPLCSSISQAELYRVTRLTVRAPALKAGDLTGMPNLRGLKVEVPTLKAGYLTGITPQLNKLIITLSGFAQKIAERPF